MQTIVTRFLYRSVGEGVYGEKEGTLDTDAYFLVLYVSPFIHTLA